MPPRRPIPDDSDIRVIQIYRFSTGNVNHRLPYKTIEALDGLWEIAALGEGKHYDHGDTN